MPADLRLLRVHNLTVDESLLTGESLAVRKEVGKVEADLPLSDRINLVYAGSTIATGRGVGVVFATGAHTAVGEIATAATSTDTTKPPLVIRMERFARDISFAVLGASAVLALIAVARGIPYSEVFFLAVALAVSAIPEGLPVALTVALAIARELGIASSEQEIVTGQMLTELGSAEMPAFVETVKGARVFARVAPMQKLEIVNALTRLGHFVAVTGDGVNDAPALRAANIGVAMGSGSDVAKDVASLIVTDDNFASIEAGVEEGRFAYDNVRKVTYLLISTGFAEVVLLVLAVVVGFPLPLFAVQLLWLNLVTNGIQDVALAFEAGEPGAMRRPLRKPTEGIFNPLMVKQTLVSGLTIGLVGFAVWFWLLSTGYDEFTARNLLLLLMMLFENVHVFNCRSEYTSAFRVPLRNNRILVIGVAVAFGAHILSMQIPLMQSLLRVAPVKLNEFGLMLVLALSVLIVMEVFKRVRRRV